MIMCFRLKRMRTKIEKYFPLLYPLIWFLKNLTNYRFQRIRTAFFTCLRHFSLPPFSSLLGSDLSNSDTPLYSTSDQNFEGISNFRLFPPEISPYFLSFALFVVSNARLIEKCYGLSSLFLFRVFLYHKGRLSFRCDCIGFCLICVEAYFNCLDNFSIYILYSKKEIKNPVDLPLSFSFFREVLTMKFSLIFISNSTPATPKHHAMTVFNFFSFWFIGSWIAKLRFMTVRAI